MTNINWKEVSQSEAYKSLKAALTFDIREQRRSKKELYKLFHWVMGRAKHYAHHQGRSVVEVLTEWEDGRDYWWLNYYGDSCQPKLQRNRTPRGINGRIKEIKRTAWYDAKSKREQIVSLRAIEARTEKSKTRWSKYEKDRAKFWREFEQEQKLEKKL